MSDVRVELYCKNEDKVVADIEIAVGGELSAQAIKAGLHNVVSSHCPAKFQDLVQLSCRCGAPLYFRTVEGEHVDTEKHGVVPAKDSLLVLAVPGMGRVEA